LKNALWSVVTRAEPLDGYSSFLPGVIRTLDALLSQYDSVLYVIGFIAILFGAILSVVVCLLKARDMNWGATVAGLAIVALLPVGWMIATQNHSAIHCWFTFRMFGVTIMALWCIMVCSLRNIRGKARENGA